MCDRARSSRAGAFTNLNKVPQADTGKRAYGASLIAQSLGLVMTRILLLEDEKDLRLLMEHVLIAAGYVVETATTVEEAGSRLDRGSYDLVIADGKLADGTGMQIADRAVEQGARALIVTGYAFLLPQEELTRYPYLLKPVRPDELLREVRAELHRNPS